MNLFGAIGADNEAALERLRRALVAQPGFQLILLEVPEGPLRDAVLGRVMAWSGEDGVPKLRRMRARGRAEIVARLAARRGGIVLEDIDSALLEDAAVDRLVGELNWQRDQLRKRIAGPLLLVISARGVARLFERAPDLATWRSHTCRITRFGEEPMLERRVGLSLDASEPDPLELERAEALLTERTQQGAPPEELAKLWLRMGDAYRRCGNVQQAREALARAEQLAQQDRMRVRVLHNRAMLEIFEREIVAAAECLDLAEPILARLPDDTLRGWACWLRSWIAWSKTDPAEVLRLGRLAVDLAGQDDDLRSRAKAVLAQTLWYQGDADAALSMCGEVSAGALSPDNVIAALRLSAEIEQSRDRPDRALPLLRRAIAVAAAQPEAQGERLAMSLELAELFLSLGKLAEARRALRGIGDASRHAPAELRGRAALLEGICVISRDPVAAQRCFGLAVKLLPGHRLEAMARFLLAVALADQDARTASQSAAQRALRLATDRGDNEVMTLIQQLLPAMEHPANITAPRSSTARRRNAQPRGTPRPSSPKLHDRG